MIAYDGTDFHGFQRQRGLRTIQGVLEDTLKKITGVEHTIFGSGRTDAGVHAYGQVCHFDTKTPIPTERLSYILRRMLPRDIVVRSAEEADSSFHARKSCYWKTYRYQIETTPVPDLFFRRFRTHRPIQLDLERMKEASQYLVGTHDFTSFCSVHTDKENKVRTIYDLRLEKDTSGVITMWITGNGFLYNMVRIIMGTLFEVGRGSWQPNMVEKALDAMDRRAGGPTFPPEGLMLWQVSYQPWK